MITVSLSSSYSLSPSFHLHFLLISSPPLFILLHTLFSLSHTLSFLRNRIVQKRINVRIEHVKHSRCREDFLKRVKENELKKRQAKEKGEKIVCKRQPVGPRAGHFVSSRGKEPELVEPIPYEFVA